MRYTCCPVCGSSALQPSISFRAPVFSNVIYQDELAARNAPQGDFEGVYCEQCGHFFNQIFDESLLVYTEAYDTSLHFSASFQEYAENLANRLVNTYDLRNKSIIEIGCGRGDFLRMLCEGKGNQGFGFDTSYDDRQADGTDEFLTFYQEYYDKKFADIPANLVVCRHVLEHVDDPVGFLKNLRSVPSWNEDTVVYFEVPNGMYSFEQLGIWDFIYEHFSYFNAASLRLTFEMAGFEVLHVAEDFGGQYLCLEARVSNAPVHAEAKTPAHVMDCLNQLLPRYNNKMEEWRQHIAEFGQAGFAIWGSGSKGVSFANLIAGDACKFLVDVNPGKQNTYIAGAGLPVRAPATLESGEVGTFVVMNPVYETEIRGMLQEAGIDGQVMVA